MNSTEPVFIREIPFTDEMMAQYDKPLSEILKEQEFEVFQAGFELGRKTVHLTVIDAWKLHYVNHVRS